MTDRNIRRLIVVVAILLSLFLTQVAWGDATAWGEVAPQLGAETTIEGMVEYNGALYAGTWPNGFLYRWNGVNAWTKVADTVDSQDRIYCLCVYNDKLYGGTYDGGRLFEWNDVDTWVEKAGKLNDETYIFDLAEYDSKLYASTGPNGNLFEWNDVNTWVSKAGLLDSYNAVVSLCAYGGKLYGGVSDASGAALLEWNDLNAWVEVAPQAAGSEIAIEDLVEYNSKLYGVTRSNGLLVEWNDVNAWVTKAPTYDNIIQLWSAVVYQGALYAGAGTATGFNGALLVWNDVNAWTEPSTNRAEELDANSDNCKGIGVFDGYLFGGFAASGILYQFGVPAVAGQVIRVISH